MFPSCILVIIPGATSLKNSNFSSAGILCTLLAHDHKVMLHQVWQEVENILEENRKKIYSA